MERRLATLASLALLTACDPTVWGALRQEAPVTMLSAPGGLDSGDFGEIVVAYRTTIAGRSVSRYAVAGGTDASGGSAHYVFYGLENVGTTTAVSQVRNGLAMSPCQGDGAMCSAGQGGAIAGIPRWSFGAMTYQGCLAAPSPSANTIHVRCESSSGTVWVLDGPPGASSFGQSAAGLDRLDDIGAALFGAPEQNMGRGALYRMVAGGTVIEIPLPGAAAIPADARLGHRIAVTPHGSLIRFALAGRSMNGLSRRVVIGDIAFDPMATDGTPAETPVTIRGCLERSATADTNWGEALAWGDLDDDGEPDLAIGESGADRIEIVDGAELAASASCLDPEPMTIERRCEDVSGLRCGSSGVGFGAALAAGDLDGDGVDDLVVGAPRADAAGRSSTGAVIALRGVASTTTTEGLPLLGEGEERSSVLAPSSAREGMRLGGGVALIAGRAASTGGPVRHEIVAGAPGARQVFVFLCSNLGSDQNAGSGCLGR